ncbi:hypothetical protein CDAR_507701 [Caerostris darwini]|uniref:Uncharacterized protein n=1 Tax=Caerostris darwini TaxID=1538125 RepID=A0AAV4U943_9ARAC|nr:hypothetical protein CDAR_507701 [Caerostris darwini]
MGLYSLATAIPVEFENYFDSQSVKLVSGPSRVVSVSDHSSDFVSHGHVCIYFTACGYGEQPLKNINKFDDFYHRMAMAKHERTFLPPCHVLASTHLNMQFPLKTKIMVTKSIALALKRVIDRGAPSNIHSLQNLPLRDRNVKMRSFKSPPPKISPNPHDSNS